MATATLPAAAGAPVSMATGVRRSCPPTAENLVKRPTEFGVEDRIDERVKETVDVSEPDEERQQYRFDVTQRR